MAVRGFIRGFHKANSRTRVYQFGYRAFSDLKFQNSDDAVLPVLIVGAGPVGLVLSILLTKLGIKCAVLEKNQVFSKHPQAHFINNRTMEVFRKMGGLAEEIERSQPPVDLWRKFIYCTSLTGPILGQVDHMQPKDFEKVVSPVSVAHLSQYKLTALLVKHLEKLGFSVCASSDREGVLSAGKILMGHECVSIDATEQCVTANVSCFEEGNPIHRKIQSKILVGTDGAGSIVRKLVGIGMRGEQDLQKLVSVHFFSKDLGQYLLNERPGMLFFIFNTEAIGILVGHDLKEGEFILQVPFYPPQQKLEDFRPEICENLITKLVGRELSDINVIDIKPWVMDAQVAEKFVCCDHRIILAGDAAHRFPPAGGFGMNTGIQDAHNLAWKITSFLNGVAPPWILNTYEMERKPIAKFNTALSVENFKAAMGVPAALGLDPTVANSVHEVINDGVGSILPNGVQRAILDGIFSIGRSQLSEYILNENNPLGSSRLSKLRRIFEEGKSLQLQFPAEDLGFRYLEGALVPDDAALPCSRREAPTGRRRDYVPCVDPGSRLPHMNVKPLFSKFSGEEDSISTLDLVSGDKVEFLVMIAPVKESYDLAHAAFKAAEEFKISTKICVLWPADDTIKSGSEAALAPWKNYIDVVVEAPDSLCWWSTCQMTNKGGAILVRPDEHIAWCVKSGIVGDPIKEMRRVFATILGKIEHQS